MKIRTKILIAMLVVVLFSVVIFGILCEAYVKELYEKCLITVEGVNIDKIAM